MRAHQIFAAMEPQRAQDLLGVLAEKAPALTVSTLAVAAAAMNARPQYLRKQPADKRAAAVRLAALARLRAEAVRDALVAEGVDAARLAFGETGSGSPGVMLELTSSQ